MRCLCGLLVALFKKKTRQEHRHIVTNSCVFGWHQTLHFLAIANQTFASISHNILFVICSGGTDINPYACSCFCPWYGASTSPSASNYRALSELLSGSCVSTEQRNFHQHCELPCRFIWWFHPGYHSLVDLLRFPSFLDGYFSTGRYT